MSDDPRTLFEPDPESESMPPTLDDDSQQSASKDDAASTPAEETASEEKPPSIQDDTTMEFSSEDSSTAKIVIPASSAEAEANTDFQKVIDSIANEPLHDDKLLDFVTDLGAGDEHPSAQSLDEKLLDSVVEHETPEETMQVEQLMESIHNDASSEGEPGRRVETLTFHKIDKDGQITEHKVLDENDLKNNKQLRLDEGSVTLTGERHHLIITDTGTLATFSAETADEKTVKPDAESEEFLRAATLDDAVDPAVPIYDAVENKDELKVFETKDCLQKAMEAMEAPAEDAGADDVASTVEDVLSALHSELSSGTTGMEVDAPVKAEDEKIVGDVKKTNEIVTPAASIVCGKRVVKDVREAGSPGCFVTCCQSGKTESEEPAKRFFKPPPNPLIFRRWSRNLCQGNQQLSFNSLICENHFRTGDIREVSVNGKKKWVLNEGALPKINSNKSSFQNFIAKKREDSKKLTTRPSGIYRTSQVSQPQRVREPQVQHQQQAAEVISGDSEKNSTAELLSSLTDIDSEGVDPGILSYNPNLVKSAQEEIISLDVLVCGLCHSVYHFLEEFQEHKLIANCRGTSTFKASLSEPKPQVWAFLLWKNAQTKILGDMESSWKLYQRWCKMPENMRDTWVAAGKSLQDANMIVGHLKLNDYSNKTGRPKSASDHIEMDEEEDPMELDMDNEVGGGDAGKIMKKPGRRKASTEDQEIKVSSEQEDELEGAEGDGGVALGGRGQVEIEVDGEDDKENENVENVVKRMRGRPPKSLQHRQPQPAKPFHNNGTEQEEFVVEKIVSRRYNQKKKQYEYLLKWEGYPPEQNTWEPAENMATCQHLLRAFEANLAKQQGKVPAAFIPTQPSSSTPGKSNLFGPKKHEMMMGPGPSSSLTPTGRPVRSSKQKALDQVKVWCGSMIKAPDAEIGGKRRLSEDSDDDDAESYTSKRIKMEQESDDSDSEASRRPIKRFGRGMKHEGPGRRGRPPMNGLKRENNLAAALGLESSGEESGDPMPGGGLVKPIIRNMSSLSPQNQQVLVASAKGVVKVDPTQVPNLTSGVYIMSNKSGIVKLDSVTPNTAISSLQKKGLLKAAPGKGGVIMLGARTGNLAPLQKSGIIRKVPPPSHSAGVATTTTTTTVTTTTASDTSAGGDTLSTVTVSASPVKMVPKGVFTTSIPTPQSTKTHSSTVIATAVVPAGTARPTGILRPLRPGTSPRPVGILRPTAPPRCSRLAGLPPKIQPAMRPRAPTGTPNRRAPLSNLLKSGVKPIESILGTNTPNTNSGQTNQKVILQKKKVIASQEQEDAKSEEMLRLGGSATPVVKKVLGSSGARSGVRGGRNFGRGRGGRTSFASLVAMTMDDVDDKLGVKESRLLDSDGVHMEFQEARSTSSDTDDGIPDDFPIGDLPPIQPESPPRPLTLCPLTGKVLAKAEGEKTPEPTPPPSPSQLQDSNDGHVESILPDHNDESMHSDSSTLIKVEMSPGGTTGTVLHDSVPASIVNAISNAASAATESPVSIRKVNSSRGRKANLSMISGSPSSTTAGANTSLGTITVPARKLFQGAAGSASAAEVEVSEEQDVVTITGEDGLLYQVSNADVSGNTLLVSSSDGGQQCVYVTTEAGADGVEGDESSTSAVLTLDTAYADAVARLIPEQFYVKEGEGGELVSLEDNEEEVGAGEDQSGQVVAQLVEAGEPAPGGGPRRVVLLLPDGNLMMTEVDEEQYAALELDK